MFKRMARFLALVTLLAAVLAAPASLVSARLGGLGAPPSFGTKIDGPDRRSEIQSVDEDDEEDDDDGDDDLYFCPSMVVFESSSVESRGTNKLHFEGFASGSVRVQISNAAHQVEGIYVRSSGSTFVLTAPSKPGRYSVHVEGKSECKHDRDAHADGVLSVYKKS